VTDAGDTLSASEELHLVLDMAKVVYVAQVQRTATVSMGVALRIAAAAVGAAQSRQLRDLVAKAKIAPKGALLELAEHEALFARRAGSEITERMAAFAQFCQRAQLEVVQAEIRDSKLRAIKRSSQITTPMKSKGLHWKYLFRSWYSARMCVPWPSTQNEGGNDLRVLGAIRSALCSHHQSSRTASRPSWPFS
jgi:hypothetical protein